MFHDKKSRWEEFSPPSSCEFIGGLLAGAGGLASGLFGFLGSNKAANQQAAAQQNSLTFERNVYDQFKNNLAPFLQGGTDIWKMILGNVGTPDSPGILTESPATFAGIGPYRAPTQADFTASPGYNYELQQGTQAIQNAANPKGGILGGNALQDIQSFGTGLAGQDWWNFVNNYNQNYWNQYSAGANQQNVLRNFLTQLAGVGQNAATLTGPQVGLTNAIGNTTANIGATNAAGTLGGFNALASLFNPNASGGNSLSTLFNSISNYYNQNTGNFGPTDAYGGTAALYNNPQQYY